MKAANADFWSGLVLGGLGAYIVVQASSWEYLGPDGPGPGFFPLWYGIAMSALSLALVLFSLREKDSPLVDWAATPRALGTWAAFAVAVAALKLAGFLVCFAALTFFIAALMYRRPLKVAATVALVATAAFYVVFPLLLGVQLP